MADIEEVAVPAGNFSCYHIVHSIPDSGTVTLEEWWADGIGMFIKMVDYGNYAQPETRALQSYPGSM